MERRQQVHSIWSEEEIIVVHDGEPVSVVDCANGVIECHGLDVEAGQDSLLVCHGGVVMRGHLGAQDNTHVTQVDVDSPQVCSAQRRALGGKHNSDLCLCGLEAVRQCSNLHGELKFLEDFAMFSILSSDTPHFPR